MLSLQFTISAGMARQPAHSIHLPPLTPALGSQTCCHAHILCGCWESDARPSGRHSRHSYPRHRLPSPWGLLACFLFFLFHEGSIFYTTTQSLYQNLTSPVYSFPNIFNQRKQMPFFLWWKMEGKKWGILNFPQSNQLRKGKLPDLNFHHMRYLEDRTHD